MREKENWIDWVLYMLDGVEQTSYETIHLIQEIEKLMKKQKELIRTHLPKLYSKDLLETLFLHPFTKIEFLAERLGITRKTASKYLQELAEIGIFDILKLGRNKYYVNKKLFELLQKSINE